MKNIIVTVAEILLGIVLFGFIFGSDNSFKKEAGDILSDVRTQLEEVELD